MWGRNRERADLLASRLRDDLPEVEILAEDDHQRSARNADILITATASRQPFLRGSWLSEGQHVTAIGADDADKRELDSGCYARADRVVIDSRVLNQQCGDLPPALKQLKIQPDELG
ncbi:hypothetical protein GCM10020220_030310 [Nonomuraea rubra]